MRINYDFGDLEAFLAVKETGSFHMAANRLNLSQSAITRRIRKLEQALDTILFARTTREVKPTLAAKRLQARAEAILEDAKETTRAMRDESMAFAHQRSALVTVATIPSVIARVLAPALLTYRDTRQTARIRVLDSAANEVAVAVAEGEADFGICSIPMLEPITSFEPLFDDQIVLVLPLDHALAGQSRIGWQDLQQTSLILPSRGTGNRLLIDEAMARARQPLRWTYEVGRSSTALELVQNGVGAALLPQSSIGAAPVASRLLDTPDIVRPIGLLTRLGQSETSASAALKQAIRDVVSQAGE